MLGFGLAQWVMVVIALCGFMTVVGVLYLGTRHEGQKPVAPSDSEAVSIWTARADARQSKAAQSGGESAQSSH